jgi:pimeloyl-ACP methyl ester carboxylesterase
MMFPKMAHRNVKIDGLDIFYREAGPKDGPTILLLHGFPTSSHMFRNLILALADEFHLVAPDYPGFGHSSAPLADKFDYTFDNLADVVEKFTEQVGLKQYALYVQDYGAPVGYRLAVRHPERVTGLVVQNGNAYEEGLENDFWKPLKTYWHDRTEKNAEPLRGFLKLEATKWQYTHGVRNVEAISPDTWTIDQALLDRPGNQELQLALFYSYGSNPAQYPPLARLLPPAPAGDPHCVGQERHDLPARWGRAVQEGLEEYRIPLARHGPLRPGRRK